MRLPSRVLPAVLLPLTIIPLSGCVTPRADDMKVAEADRWEASNRKIYNFNKGVDRYALKPASSVYRAIVPKPGRTAVSNVFSEYGEPSNFLNSVLQGKIKQAFRSVDRFLLNATLGVGGVMDVATDLGRPQEPEDFGQTFAVWGIKSGPYVMLPFLGPSTLRDAFAVPFDFFIYPSDWARNAAFHPTLLARTAQITGRFINLRSKLTDSGADGLLAGSLDEYATVRSAYLQGRTNLIWDGNPPYVPDDDGSDVPPPSAPPTP